MAFPPEPGRAAGLAGLWVSITVLLNALIVPLSVSGLEAVPVWEILGSRELRPEQLRRFCAVDASARSLLAAAFERLDFSA